MSVISAWPGITRSPGAHNTAATVPSRGAVTGTSIFLASRMARTSPSRTSSPEAASTRYTFPAGRAETGEPVAGVASTAWSSISSSGSSAQREISSRKAGALDAQTKRSLQDYLLQVWREVNPTILMVTHDVEEAVYLASRVYVMSAHPGRVAAEIAVPFGADRSRDLKRDPTFLDVRDQVQALLADEALAA